MEILLAIVVASAVIFFGALISMGNERQRKAIDDLSQHIAHWIIQDLKLKREESSKNVVIKDPIEWLNHLSTMINGVNLGLVAIDYIDAFQILTCTSYEGKTIYFSPLDPRKIQKHTRELKNRLSRTNTIYQIKKVCRSLYAKEVSILNGGILFDIELRIAWKALTKKDIDQVERLWIYSIY
jgi:hypothetical protein